MANIAKTITFTYKKTAYTLEFTRETVSALEQNGLTLADVRQMADKPLTASTLLFRGAFLAHHKRAAAIDSLMEEIWKSIPDKPGFISALTEMYTEPLDALLEEPDESGKTEWKINQ